MSKPIKKEPIILTNKVPTGKYGKYNLKKYEIINLKVDPKAPPTAIYKILTIKLYFISELLLQYLVFFQL